ncbi:MAG: bifunctional 5,10-methylene-tetrahydrofolate dehydrogenase/5,10-methylene-tetrahydrofolate cyclohydrolase, partial [Spirochaetes bacterium]|nr:bifunctional 5,10-methylene-tetrahydrofolate dehydrogenase/5,10-methylene-tetrahydrofolate cyclohydrolase [Spirochaetota bacterium]
GQDTYYPCTPYGIQKLLIESGFPPKGKHVVVVGRSNIVGKPVAMILVQKNDSADGTVTICHSRTKNLKQITNTADILIAAIGQPQFIKADMVKSDCVVIDVGVNRVDDPETEKGYRLVGDVAFEEVKNKVKAISPVPGGVGPMTIIMLMLNTLKAFKKINGF